MSLPCGLIWCLYGIEIRDPTVIVPPFYDLCLYSVQLGCVTMYKKVTAVKEAAKKE